MEKDFLRWGSKQTHARTHIYYICIRSCSPLLAPLHFLHDLYNIFRNSSHCLECQAFLTRADGPSQPFIIHSLRWDHFVCHFLCLCSLVMMFLFCGISTTTLICQWAMASHSVPIGDGFVAAVIVLVAVSCIVSFSFFIWFRLNRISSIIRFRYSDALFPIWFWKKYCHFSWV